MTRDEIIALARLVRDGGHWNQLDIIRFGELVAAAEREACAKLLESRRSGANELMDATREMEAYAIRARGETK